jgi:hypothetical protein
LITDFLRAFSMALGGARPGAGRKPKAEKYRPAINKAEKKIVDKLPSIVDSMIDLAEGVKVEEIDLLTGEPRVYSRPPDRAACQYLIDRILGKPVERQEHTGENGGAIEIATRIVVDGLDIEDDDSNLNENDTA